MKSYGGRYEMPKKHANEIELILSQINFSNSGTSAIRMAAHEINTQGLIPGGYITLIEKDSFPTNGLGQTSVTDAVYAAVTLLQQGVVGVIGDVSSSWTSLSALMTGALQIPQCSFSASASKLTFFSIFFLQSLAGTIVPLIYDIVF
jgi:ABC-type branched-subunit amino acid transport system substrate-binding protein